MSEIPTTKENLDHSITCRLTEAEYKAFIDQAGLSGLKVSAYFRDCVLRGNRVSPGAHGAHYLEILCAVNLVEKRVFAIFEQIKAGHEGGRIPPDQYEKLLNSLQAIISGLREAIQHAA